MPNLPMFEWEYTDWFNEECVSNEASRQVREASCLRVSGSIQNQDQISGCKEEDLEPLERIIFFNSCSDTFTWGYTNWEDDRCVEESRMRQTRSATCQDNTTGLEALDPQLCGPEQPLEQIVDSDACAAYSWNYTAWLNQTCSVSNPGKREQTRTATCVNDATGVEATDPSKCGAQEALSQLITDPSCDTYSWRYSDWVTHTCRAGRRTQTRTAACLNDVTGIEASDTARCGAQGPLQQSVNDPSCNTYNWGYTVPYVSPGQTCPSDPGQNVSQVWMLVRCYANGSTRVDPSFCPARTTVFDPSREPPANPAQQGCYDFSSFP